MREQVELEIIRQELGEATLWRLIEIFGGQSVYIPKRPLLLKRRQDIRAEFARILKSGMVDSQATLAISKRFGISRKWARMICHGQLELEFAWN